VFNVLLQLLDDGRLTDGQGRTVNFTNTIVIMTSNLGARFIQEASDLRDAQVQAEVMAALRAHFRPEFLNRIDEVIIFNRLGKEQLREILEIQLRGLRQMLAQRKIRLEVSPQAADLLVAEGWSPEYGARPLARTIQNRLQNPIATKILAGEVKEENTIFVESRNGELLLRVSA
ncbi:MAG: AAA family ATPase, partial [Planctomycetota bacterium]|nr:AAA family ATPase [Planctomycetota bacterium]